MPKLVSGAMLLGWQVLAFLLSLTGWADAVLASSPDAAWLSLVLSVLLTPPVWLAEVAVGLGAAFCFWALAERLQRPYAGRAFFARSGVKGRIYQNKAL